MSPTRKFGQLKLDGSSPMNFVEVEGVQVDPWSPAEEEIAAAVAKSIKAYVESIAELANGRFQHLRASLPEYLAHPGNYLAVVCSDGIVVRYEKESHEQRKGAVAVMRQPLREVAALLSQKLIHISTPESPLPSDDQFGVELRMAAHSPSTGVAHELVAQRIWFQTEPFPLPKGHIVGTKPYCLLSVRNRLELEIQGALAVKLQ